MISKELLSAVYPIDETAETYVGIQESTGRVMWFGKEYNDCRSEIDIHRVAHKCKEWALDNRWMICTMPMLTEKKWRNTSVRLSHFYSAGKDRYLDGIYHNGRIEAIFKACQWILDKDSK